MRSTDDAATSVGTPNWLGAVAVCLLLAIMTVSIAVPVSAADPTYSSTTAYQGELVYADVSDFDNISVGDTLSLRTVESFDGDAIGDSSRVTSVRAERTGDLRPFPDGFNPDSGDPVVEIDTGELESGDYFLTHQQQATQPGREATIEVTEQNLDVSFKDGDTFNEGDTEDVTDELTVDSNRGTYGINVSADGDLSDEELLRIFLGNDLDPAGSEGFDAVDYESAIKPNGVAIEGGDGDSTFAFDVDAAEDALDNYDGVAGFEETTWNPVPYAESEADHDEKILLWKVSDTNKDVNFDSVDTGAYELDTSVVDATADASETVNVRERDVSVTFDRDQYSLPAGEIVSITADIENSDDAYVRFGDEDAGFVDILYLRDDNDDGTVTFTINTRLLGTGVDAAGVDRAVGSANDTVESYLGEGGRWSADDADLPQFYQTDDTDEIRPSSRFENTANGDNPGAHFDAFAAYLSELALLSDPKTSPTEQLVRPLQPADYTLVATGTPAFAAEDGNSAVVEEDGLAQVTLKRPRLEKTTAYVGPPTDTDPEVVQAESEYELTARDTVAIGDTLVAEIHAEGIYGAIAAESEDAFSREALQSVAVNRESDWVGDGIRLTIEATDPVGQHSNTLQLTEGTDDELTTLFDPDESTIYIIIDTQDAPFDRPLSDGDQLSFNLGYETAEDRFRFFDAREGSLGAYTTIGSNTTPDALGPFGGPHGDETTAVGSFPYYSPGESAVTSRSIEIESPNVEFDAVQDGDVHIDPADPTVSGQTNIAPGSDLRVALRGDPGANIRQTQQVTVGANGTFEARFESIDAEIGQAAQIEFGRWSGQAESTTNSAVFGTVDRPAPFEPTVMLDAPSEADAGDTVDVGVTARNTGERTGSADLSVTAGKNETVGSIDLSGGEASSWDHTIQLPENESRVTVEAEYGSASDQSSINLTRESVNNEDTPNGDPAASDPPDSATPEPSAGASAGPEEVPAYGDIMPFGTQHITGTLTVIFALFAIILSVRRQSR